MWFCAGRRLRREVSRGSDNVVEPGQAWGVVVDPHGGAEVRQPNVWLSTRLQEDVVGFDVAVDDPCPMDGLERGEQLVPECDDPAFRQGPVIGQYRAQGPAAHQGHGEHHPVVLPHPAQWGEDVGVAEPQALLTEESDDGHGIRLGEDLSGEVASFLVVPDAPDASVAA